MNVVAARSNPDVIINIPKIPYSMDLRGAGRHSRRHASALAKNDPPVLTKNDMVGRLWHFAS
jgi:hypothetical protein